MKQEILKIRRLSRFRSIEHPKDNGNDCQDKHNIK